jgi:hypothetical protein
MISGYGALAQGIVRNVNNATGFLSAKVYGHDPTNPYQKLSGNTTNGLPAGSTVYQGSALAGTGFTSQLWGIGGITTDSSALLPIQNGTSIFRTGGAAGIGIETAAAIQNAPGGPGSHATLQVRVWDNRGGTITTWQQALGAFYGGQGSIGYSDLFGVDNLGDNGSTLPPLLLNLRSFSLNSIPEPSGSLLLGFGALCITLFRRRAGYQDSKTDSP